MLRWHNADTSLGNLTNQELYARIKQSPQIALYVDDTWEKRNDTARFYVIRERDTSPGGNEYV